MAPLSNGANSMWFKSSSEFSEVVGYSSWHIIGVSSVLVFFIFPAVYGIRGVLILCSPPTTF